MSNLKSQDSIKKKFKKGVSFVEEESPTKRKNKRDKLDSRSAMRQMRSEEADDDTQAILKLVPSKSSQSRQSEKLVSNKPKSKLNKRRTINIEKQSTSTLDSQIHPSSQRAMVSSKDEETMKSDTMSKRSKH